MPRARWNGVVVAESEQFEEVDGNVYFPPSALVEEHFRPSDHRTTCFWKGQAHYYDLVVDGAENPAAAWFYPEPKARAKPIEGYVAFWKGVEVER